MIRFHHNFFVIFFTISLLVLLGGCGSRNRSRAGRIAQESTRADTLDCTLHVEGVECQFCAQSVVDLLTNTPGVQQAHYHATDETYEGGYATFVFDTAHGEFAREQLEAGLAKEGFSLVSLSPSNIAQIPT